MSVDNTLSVLIMTVILVTGNTYRAFTYYMPEFAAIFTLLCVIIISSLQ